MTVISEKTSSDDCKLGGKALKNGSRKDLFRHRYCNDQKIKSKTTVAKIISESATVRVIKQLNISPPCPWQGEGFSPNRSRNKSYLMFYCHSQSVTVQNQECLFHTALAYGYHYSYFHIFFVRQFCSTIGIIVQIGLYRRYNIFQRGSNLKLGLILCALIKKVCVKSERIGIYWA